MKKLIYPVMFLSLLLSAAPALAQVPGITPKSGSVMQSIFDSLERLRETRQERAEEAAKERQPSEEADLESAPKKERTRADEARKNTEEKKKKEEAASTTPAASTGNSSGTPAAAQTAAAAASLSALGDQNGTPERGVYENQGLNATQLQILLTAALAMAVAGFLLVERRTLERLLAAPARRAHSSLRV